MWGDDLRLIEAAERDDSVDALKETWMNDAKLYILFRSKELGELAEADQAKELDKIVNTKLSPINEQWVRILLARIQVKQGKNKEAKANYQKSIALSPKHSLRQRLNR